MLKIYGTMLCPDCADCREAFDKARIPYEYLDFSEDIRHLKAFLAIRDGSELFDKHRGEGMIGVPCIVKEDGSVTLNWEDCL